MTKRKTIRNPVLPEKVKKFLLVVLIKLIGLTLVLCGIVGLVGLFSYYPYDGSLNVASSDLPMNMLGTFGAYFSDFMWQTTGFAAVLLPVALLVWGGWIITAVSPTFVFFRIFALFAGMIMFSAAWAGFELAPFWPVIAGAGGAAGLIIFKYSFLGLSVLDLGVYAIILHESLAFFFLFFSLWLICFALGAKFWHLLKQTITGIGIITLYLFAKIKSVYNNQPPAISKPQEVIKAPRPSILKKALKREKTAVKQTTEKTVPVVAPSSAKKGDFALPKLDFLSNPVNSGHELSEAEMQNNAARLEAALLEYGVKGEVVKVLPGPVVTLYEFNPAFGVRSARVIGLADDVARSMGVLSVRISTIPERTVLGVEVPNKVRETVYLKELFNSKDFTESDKKLLLVLGKNIGGRPVLKDLVTMPHLLIAGTTGSGKSVAVNTMILSLLYRLSPDECKMIMIDPKMLEFSMYNDIPHLLTPVVTEPKKAVVALNWAVKEMDDRYRAMSQLNVRNIEGYNQKLAEITASGKTPTRRVQIGFDSDGNPIMEEQELNLKPYPYVVVIVDEMADLMLCAGKDVETAIQKLSQKSRASGIHLILATQRPSTDVITGVIKANFPVRISFQVSSRFDSQTILNKQGAEQLLGKGDMLFAEPGKDVIRAHGPFVSDSEVEAVVSFLKSQQKPEYLDAVVQDDDDEDFGSDFAAGTGEGGGGTGKGIYEQAVAIVRQERKVSISYLQRRLSIGYNKSADIVERMEREGIVTPPSVSGKREILLPEE